MKSKLNSLRKPDEFIEHAKAHGAEMQDAGDSRVVVRYQGKTIDFSRRDNQEYSRSYRLILIKAFLAAGLITLLVMIVVRLMS